MGKGSGSRARGRGTDDRSMRMGARFYLQAERDLEFARVLMRPRGYYLAASLAHQAAEKALKAACWHLRGAEPPWKHDLHAIAELLVDNPSAVPVEVGAALDLLTPVYEKGRYPSGDEDEPIPSDLIEDDVALDAIRAAEEVMAWTQRLRQEPPGRLRSGTNS